LTAGVESDTLRRLSPEGSQMKIRLDAARDEPFRWQETLHLAPERLGLGPDQEIGPVEVRGTLTYAPPNYLLQARLAYRRKVVCDRCLGPVEESVASDWTLVVVPGPERSERAQRADRSARAGREGREARGGGPEREALDERELEADDLGVVELAGDTLDTEPCVAEQVVLELPTHPLCRDECAGLCPRCGRNLNDGACGCAPPDPDPRWGALAALRDKMDGRA
jgi:uncharacterized protein